VRYLFLLIILINILFYSFIIFKPLNTSGVFIIAKNDFLNDVFSHLEKKENIFFPKSIKLIFPIFQKDKFLSLGEYQIDRSDNLYSIFNKIFNGKIILNKFLIPEGSKINNLFSEELMDNFCLIKNFPIPCALEGRVMPDTYFYNRESELIDILNIAYGNQNRLLNKTWKNRNESLSNLSESQLLIVASIIEKEACVNERKKISGVIYNRLNKDMLLQMDSTTIYGLKNFDGDLKKKHLKDSSLYNTYMYKGLPPGPISNPSKESIFAAAKPEIHEFLYFVAKDTCSHEFSTNYDDHLSAVKKYQLNK